MTAARTDSVLARRSAAGWSTRAACATRAAPRRRHRRTRAKPRRSISRASGSRSSTRIGAGAWSRRRKATTRACRSTTKGGASPTNGTAAQDGALRSVRRGGAAAHADAPADPLGRRRAARLRNRRGPADPQPRRSARRRRPPRARCKGNRRRRWVTPPRAAGGPGLAGAGGGARAHGRLSRGQDDESDAGLVAPQRRAVQRGRRRHGVLRALRGAERRRVARW